MMQAFYKVKPTQDTPYRQLSLLHTDEGWRVRLAGGTKWGREHAEELKVIAVESFDDGLTPYDKLFTELTKEGWKPYSPQQSW
jgi:hypothetical protein